MQTSNSRYEKAKRRFINCKHNKMASDKELIEFLEEEIEQYRDRIESQSRIIKDLNGLNNKEILKWKAIYIIDEEDESTCPPIEIRITKAY